MIIDAALSMNRKFVECGKCGGTLGRRDRVVRGDGSVVHQLVLDDDWHWVPGYGDVDWGRLDAPLQIQPISYSDRGTVPRHMMRTSAAQNRLAAGRPPTRSKRTEEGDDRQASLAHPDVLILLCPWGNCRSFNKVRRRKLRLTA